MQKTRALPWLVPLVVAALAGCAGGDDAGDDGTDSDDMDDGHGDGNETVTVRHLAFQANTTNGTVPLNVTFTANVTTSEEPAGRDDGNETGNTTTNTTTGGTLGLRSHVVPLPVRGLQGDENETMEPTMMESHGNESQNFTWTFVPGDGSDALDGSQDDFPLNATHSYGTAGNYTAVLTVTFEDGETLERDINITARLAEGGEGEEPPQLVFEFGPSLGCTADVQGNLCVSFQMGPGSPGIDGFWVPLDERYVGLTFIGETSEPVRGDTDGLFTDADGNDIGVDANGGAGAATGVVPAGAAWLFVFNYAIPSTSITVTFS